MIRKKGFVHEVYLKSHARWLTDELGALTVYRRRANDTYRLWVRVDNGYPRPTLQQFIDNTCVIPEPQPQ